MKKYISNFIFLLADKYHIQLDSTKQAEFLDECYFGFCKEYVELCQTRDINLKQHLIDKPSLFRTFKNKPILSLSRNNQGK